MTCNLKSCHKVHMCNAGLSQYETTGFAMMRKIGQGDEITNMSQGCLPYKSYHSPPRFEPNCWDNSVHRIVVTTHYDWGGIVEKWKNKRQRLNRDRGTLGVDHLCLVGCFACWIVVKVEVCSARLRAPSRIEAAVRSTCNVINLKHL